jgi:hypothetical protein
LLVLVCVGVSGCYAPSYADCEVTCNSNMCPSDLECRDGFCRIAGETASCSGIADRDQDTIVDASDNCPDLANTDQANEDGDSFGDVCDPCPPYGNATANADNDGDGVGDGCDPRVNVAGDKIVLFEAFNAAPAGVMVMGFTFSGGKARAMASGPNAAELTWEQPVYANEKVSTFATLTSMTPQGVTYGVVDQLDLADPVNAKLTDCTAGYYPPPNSTTSVLQVFETNGPSQAVSLGNLLDQGLTLSLARVTRAFTCYSSLIPGQPLTLNSTRALPLRPNMGLVVTNATVDFDWFMIVSSP